MPVASEPLANVTWPLRAPPVELLATGTPPRSNRMVTPARAGARKVTPTAEPFVTRNESTATRFGGATGFTRSVETTAR